MPVKPLAAERKEKVTRTELARIGANSRDLLLGAAADELSAASCGNELKAARFH